MTAAAVEAVIAFQRNCRRPMSPQRHRTSALAALLLALAGPSGGEAWAQRTPPTTAPPIPAPAPKPAPAPAPAEELPLSGPAFILADEAYRAMEKHDYRTALIKAEEALRQRPDMSRLKRLVVSALEKMGNPLEAERRAAEFVAAGDNDPALVAERDRLQRNLQGSALARAQMDVLKAPNDPAARARLAQLLAAKTAPAPNPAYLAAEAAYKAAGRQDYDRPRGAPPTRFGCSPTTRPTGCC